MNATTGIIHYLEIVTPDVEGVRASYEASTGLSFRPADPVLGNAVTVRLPGGPTLGVRAPMHPSEKPIVRIYLRIPDLDAAVGEAVRSGAAILLDRMELPGHGAIAIYERGGIEHGLWEVR